MQEIHYLVPDQIKGEEKNLEVAKSASDIEEAEDWFVDAKERLWNVNHWKQAGQSTYFHFSLADNYGHLLNRKPRKGDHIRIGKNDSGLVKGEEHDWFIVEALEYDDYPDENRESFAIHLSPVKSLLISGLNTTPEAVDLFTITLVIERDHRILKALYHGRNEFGHLEKAAEEAKIEKDNSSWPGLKDDDWQRLLKWFMDGK